MPEQIHRQTVTAANGVMFKAPRTITFDYQPKRHDLSVWYRSGDTDLVDYMVVNTGMNLPAGAELVATVITDGFYAYHLVRVQP